MRSCSTSYHARRVAAGLRRYKGDRVIFYIRWCRGAFACNSCAAHRRDPRRGSAGRRLRSSRPGSHASQLILSAPAHRGRALGYLHRRCSRAIELALAKPHSGLVRAAHAEPALIPSAITLVDPARCARKPAKAPCVRAGDRPALHPLHLGTPSFRKVWSRHVGPWLRSPGRSGLGVNPGGLWCAPTSLGGATPISCMPPVSGSTSILYRAGRRHAGPAHSGRHFRTQLWPVPGGADRVPLVKKTRKASTIRPYDLSNSPAVPPRARAPTVQWPSH